MAIGDKKGKFRPLSEGLATDEKQGAIIDALNLGELAPILRNLFFAMTSPGWLDKPNYALRVNPIGGTVGTVTALTNVDGYNGRLLMLNQNKAAWAQVVRSRIS